MAKNELSSIHEQSRPRLPRDQEDKKLQPAGMTAFAALAAGLGMLVGVAALAQKPITFNVVPPPRETPFSTPSSTPNRFINSSPDATPATTHDPLAGTTNPTPGPTAVPTATSTLYSNDYAGPNPARADHLWPASLDPMPGPNSSNSDHPVPGTSYDPLPGPNSTPLPPSAVAP